MKQFATKKEIKSRFNTIIEANFGRLQSLLAFKNPDYYWSGQYGWYCDIYIINGIAICIGHNPFGNYNATHELCKPFEERAREIFKMETDFKKQDKLLDNLIADFIGTVTGGAK